MNQSVSNGGVISFDMQIESNKSLNVFANHSIGSHKMISNATETSVAGDTGQSASNTNEYLLQYVKKILTIADIGYSISLVVLVVALLILTCIRRLRSPRNNLHLQLFISFIMRCSSHLIRRLYLRGAYSTEVSRDIRRKQIAR